ncbi:Cof-type HAD-IIB family hydrolase [Tepidibacillus infernus]|uniref:Cof-type HAD-IIB family hydrolase n=1 Tax=Tepidibacillus infernus TaxID=1806172 RepID=UPI003B740169
MSYKIVFFDIDGTLVNEEKQIPNDTKEAIKRLKERGIEVAIATGRAPFHFTKIREELGIDSFVSFNGSYVVYKGEVIYHHPFRQEDLSLLEQEAKRRKHTMVFLSHKDFFANVDQDLHVIQSFHSLKLTPPKYRQQYWQEETIYQALLYCEADEEKYYHDHYPHFHFVRWHQYSMDVIPKGGSKAKGIEMFLRKLDINPSEAVAFGDGLNDREMLSFVGAGVAMGNAHEEVKPFAKFTTKHVDEGGIRFGLKQLQLI